MTDQHQPRSIASMKRTVERLRRKRIGSAAVEPPRIIWCDPETEEVLPEEGVEIVRRDPDDPNIVWVKDLAEESKNQTKPDKTRQKDGS